MCDSFGKLGPAVASCLLMFGKEGRPRVSVLSCPSPLQLLPQSQPPWELQLASSFSSNPLGLCFLVQSHISAHVAPDYFPKCASNLQTEAEPPAAAKGLQDQGGGRASKGWTLPGEGLWAEDRGLSLVFRVDLENRFYFLFYLFLFLFYFY